MTSSLRPFAFVLAVPDLDRSSAFFTDTLGFEAEWQEATDWRLLSRGEVRIMIGRCPGAMPAAAIGDHSYFAYLEVDDVDALHAEFSRRGASVQAAPVDMPYGMREFLVTTPDGHRMMIGQDMKAKAGR